MPVVILLYYVIWHLLWILDAFRLTKQGVIAGELVPEKDNEGSRYIYFYTQYFRNSRNKKEAYDKIYSVVSFFRFSNR